MSGYTRLLVILCISLMAFISSGCGFRLRGQVEVPAQLKTILLENSDPYGPLNRAIIKELRYNGIEIAEDKTRTDIPVLRILTVKNNQNTVSIFADGKTAEYQLTLEVNAQVLLPNKGLYPLYTRVSRSFFDNPLTALAKDEERSLINIEMDQSIARQLVRRLLTINIDNLKNTLPDEIERHDVPVSTSVSSEGLPPLIINNEYIIPNINYD